MPMLFCNIGWMEHYNGINDDSINRGGAYNNNAIGHEVCNFSDINGTIFGYVQPVGEQIKVEKIVGIKVDKNTLYVEGVTVVWTAGPKNGGTVVVGWYKDATVFRDSQKPENRISELHQQNNINSYRIKAPADKAVLLPIEQRLLLIPRAVKGRIGQSNVWYADAPESREIVEKVKQLIAQGEIQQPIDIDNYFSGSEGNPRLVTHLKRERNAYLVTAKKEATIREKGKLCCEVCNFNFAEVYGELGEDFCEVHHLTPLAQADGVVKTTLDDLAILCSNCHRIIHRTNPMINISVLRKTVENIRKKRR